MRWKKYTATYLSLAAANLAAATPSVLRDVKGNVEQQLSTWQPAEVGQTITQALRIGSGRGLFQSGDGQVLAASQSRLRIYKNEPDLQTGKFYITGQLSFFAQSAHFSGNGQIRLDAVEMTRRIAVISGKLRLSAENKTIILNSGQQYDFGTKKVSEFSEYDAWYTSQFSGQGQVTVEATKGPVTVHTELAAGDLLKVTQTTITPQVNATLSAGRTAVPGQQLNIGEQLLTGAGAWAEVGFSGGGYLRLQPNSALSVLSIDKVSDRSGKAKRQITLKLLRGSAWNVVAKRQGSYEITTPTITTAVRGTIFRVDADGLVKVFEGQVALPSSAGMLVKVGEQRRPGGEVQPLTLDALDVANQALDQSRAVAIQLNLEVASSSPELQVLARSQPDAHLTLKVGDTELPLSGNAEGVFTLDPLEQLKDRLPEGRYDITVTAQRSGSQKTLSRALLIDRTAPQISNVQMVRRGQVARISGQITDQSPVVTLSAEISGQVYTRTLRLPQRADLDWVLPLASAEAVINLTLTDQAGNVTKYTDLGDALSTSANSSDSQFVGYVAAP